MKACFSCSQPSPEDARFCQHCGTAFAPPTDEPEQEGAELLRSFIGPNADRYLAQFKKFSDGPQPGFALTWHWPAFLFDPFLWFLYRKMYLYALVYAVGPVVSAVLTGDLTVGIIWRIIAGASANYVYFWHVKEQIGRVLADRSADAGARERMIREAGGVQPYVIWVGVILHILLVALLVAAVHDEPPDGKMPMPGRRVKTSTGLKQVLE